MSLAENLFGPAAESIGKRIDGVINPQINESLAPPGAGLPVNEASIQRVLDAWLDPKVRALNNNIARLSRAQEALGEEKRHYYMHRVSETAKWTAIVVGVILTVKWLSTR